MVQIGILFTKKHRLISIAAILDLFETANRLVVEKEQPVPFAIRLLYAGDLPENYTAYPLVSIENASDIDLALIPAFADGDLKNAVKENSQYIGWLQKQHLKGTEIGSFCSGAFLLAASGLLNDKPATTHINAVNNFRLAFPRVILKEDAVITAQDGIFTSGGATNSFHLLLMLVAKYCGREIAVTTAKFFAIDLNREQQAYFKSSPLVREHSDDLVKIVEREITLKFMFGKNIEEIIKDVPASRRNLVRRFKKATGITPIAYLQNKRIEAAKHLLEQSPLNIQEIMVASGYNDMKTFRMLFKKNVGIGLKEYRDKFNGQKLMHVA